MSIVNKLSSSQGRKDELPNLELAKEVVFKADKTAVEELCQLITVSGTAIQNDCIKVLYEVGEKNPALISRHLEFFVVLLSHKNNRIQWGAMTALDSITGQNPKLVYAQLSKILKAVDQGSVITKDHAVNILIKLSAFPEYSGNTFELLFDLIQSSPDNQLPMYADKALPVIPPEFYPKFSRMLESRKKEMEKESKRKSIQKLINMLSVK